MAETVQQRVAEVLWAHRSRPTGSAYCICGWRPALMLNDTESDRRQRIWHQAQMLADAGLLAAPVEPGMPPRSAEPAPVATDGRDEGREGL